MKKLFLITLAFILVACSSQVTVTSTAIILPPTETPIPTPTLNPDFVAVQTQISELSENLTLSPDGTIENNGVPISNLHVDQNGVINIIFNNEHVAIEMSQISFDAENGLTIEGYELNENGEWVEAQEIFVTNDGLQMILSDEMIGDNRVIEKFFAPEALSFNITEEEWLARLDPTTIGYEPGELTWVMSPEGKVELINAESEVVARWKEVGTRGCSTVVWDAQKMGEGDDNPIHNIGKGYEGLDNAEPIQAFKRNWGKRRMDMGDIAFEFGLDWKSFSGLLLFSTDRSSYIPIGYFYDGIGPEVYLSVLTPQETIVGFLLENLEGSAFEVER